MNFWVKAVTRLGTVDYRGVHPQYVYKAGRYFGFLPCSFRFKAETRWDVKSVWKDYLETGFFPVFLDTHAQKF